jgi:DNA-binding NarL/FixJ family response regulator
MIYHCKYKNSSTVLVNFILADLTSDEVVEASKPLEMDWERTDTLILDLVDENGYKLAGKILRMDSHPKLIGLVFFENDAAVSELVQHGLTGLIYESDPITTIINNFSRIIIDNEDVVLSEKFIKAFFKGTRIRNAGILTTREHQILKMLKMGMTSVEISNELFVSKTTVRTHFKNIYEKLNVNSKSQAIGKALEQRLI